MGCCEVTKPAILYIAHNYFNRAGVEEHVRDLRLALHDRYAIHVAFPHAGQYVLLGPDDNSIAWPGDQVHWPLAQLETINLGRAFAAIMTAAKPALIHVQHFANWPLGVLDKALATGLPVVISHHDYFPITPYFTMQGVPTPEDCFSPAECLRLFGADISVPLRRRSEFIGEILRRADVNIAPSSYLAAVLKGVYRSMDCRVVEHGIKSFPRPLRRSENGPLRFGYVGAVLPQKGAEFLLHAYARAGFSPERCELHFFGGAISTDVPGVHFHGPYEPGHLPRICSEIDIAVIPSLFPETYSLVLSEMLMGGLPIVASDIGALGARVRALECGRTFTPGDADNLIETLRWFVDHDHWRSWAIPLPRIVQDMASDYADIYDSLIAENCSRTL